MQAFNKVIIAGNLTRDPELRYLPKGTAVAEITLALNHKWKTEGGEVREEVSFIDCVLWGRTAENVTQYIKKGDPLLVEGRLKQESWEDKNDGKKRTKVKVIAEKTLFMPKSSDNDTSGGTYVPPKDDDVPF